MDIALYEEEEDRNDEEAQDAARDEHIYTHHSIEEPVAGCFWCDDEVFERQEAEREEAA